MVSHSISYFDFNPRPREEGDPTALKFVTYVSDFNPRPREEGDFRGMLKLVGEDKFQSTPS